MHPILDNIHFDRDGLIYWVRTRKVDELGQGALKLTLSFIDRIADVENEIYFVSADIYQFEKEYRKAGYSGKTIDASLRSYLRKLNALGYLQKETIEDGIVSVIPIPIPKKRVKKAVAEKVVEEPVEEIQEQDVEQAMIEMLSPGRHAIMEIQKHNDLIVKAIEIENDNMCILCEERVQDIILIPCAHSQYCRECINKEVLGPAKIGQAEYQIDGQNYVQQFNLNYVGKCPVCRDQVESVCQKLTVTSSKLIMPERPQRGAKKIEWDRYEQRTNEILEFEKQEKRVAKKNKVSE